MWGIVDCDNCYVSCERVFRPDLEGRAVVVLSNNDGCVVARSNEAKALGIKMGMPYFQMLQQFKGKDITAFSSNYELYGDMSARVMNILIMEVPRVLQYSIDEAFLDLRESSDMAKDPTGLTSWGELLAAKIRQWTGMPVSIGIAPTKTLAKIASRFAKRYPAYRKCCLIYTDAQREKALQKTKIGDVWGIGRRLDSKMRNYGIITAYDFAQRSSTWVQNTMNVTGFCTWRELHGEDCIDVEGTDIRHKSICTSRSFAEMVDDMDTLSTHVSNFAIHCARKLRRENTLACHVTVFIDTNRFRTDLPQYQGSSTITLPTPTASDIEISAVSIQILKKIYRRGFMYKRAGVIVTSVNATVVETNFIDYEPERREKISRLTIAIDKINDSMGNDTVMIASQQYADTTPDGILKKFSQKVKRDFKSPSYSTNPNEFKIT